MTLDLEQRAVRLMQDAAELRERLTKPGRLSRCARFSILAAICEAEKETGAAIELVRPRIIV